MVILLIYVTGLCTSKIESIERKSFKNKINLKKEQKKRQPNSVCGDIYVAKYSNSMYFLTIRTRVCNKN